MIAGFAAVAFSILALEKNEINKAWTKGVLLGTVIGFAIVFFYGLWLLKNGWCELMQFPRVPGTLDKAGTVLSFIFAILTVVTFFGDPLLIWPLLAALFLIFGIQEFMLLRKKSLPEA